MKHCECQVLELWGIGLRDIKRSNLSRLSCCHMECFHTRANSKLRSRFCNTVIRITERTHEGKGDEILCRVFSFFLGTRSVIMCTELVKARAGRACVVNALDLYLCFYLYLCMCSALGLSAEVVGRSHSSALQIKIERSSHTHKCFALWFERKCHWKTPPDQHSNFAIELKFAFKSLVCVHAG